MEGLQKMKIDLQKKTCSLFLTSLLNWNKKIKQTLRLKY
jgi:hypothetical protein